MAQRAHLLEAIQRCVFFLHESESKLAWPLAADDLARRKKDVALFESLAAINERFAKLQDTLAAAMRHSALLMGESTDGFLKVLALFEKLGVVDSTEDWQRVRAASNLAAHDYELDYVDIAEHLNTVHSLVPSLYATAAGRPLPGGASHRAGHRGFFRRVRTDRGCRRVKGGLVRAACVEAALPGPRAEWKNLLREAVGVCR